VIVPDANLLLYAYDASSPFHKRAVHWWESALNGSEPIGLTHPVIFAFLRIGTQARIFERPLSLAEAEDHIRGWLARRVVRVLQPDPGHALEVLTLLEQAGSAGGNLVTDAQIAALALAHKARVHTADRDFLRFTNLQCVFPLDRNAG
jgi:hypothetical protein